MNRVTQKFNGEILALKGLKRENVLHPLLKQQIKGRIIGAISALPKAAALLPRRGIDKVKILRYLAPVTAGILLCAGTVFASGGSNPGDPLYPVKLAKENIELTLAPTAKAKAEARAAQAETRLEELEKIDADSSKAPLRQQTETAAKLQVASAIKNLTLVKKQLAVQGDAKGAADLGSSILSLKQKADLDKIFTATEQKQIDGSLNPQ